MLSYILIAAAYLFGAFYFQKLSFFTDRSIKKYALSLLFFAIPFAVPIAILSDSFLEPLIYLLFVIDVHLVFFIWQGGFFKIKVKGLTAFICTHVPNIALLLFAVGFLFSGSAAYEQMMDILSSAVGDRVELFSYLLLSLLICLKPSSELVGRAMDHFCSSDSPQDKRECGEYTNAKPADEPVDLGSTIGMFERIIVLILGFMGWYVAIAFVITAKSIARFKKFDENPTFAGRFLIGTFTSILIPVILLFIMGQVL